MAIDIFRLTSFRPSTSCRPFGRTFDVDQRLRKLRYGVLLLAVIMVCGNWDAAATANTAPSDFALPVNLEFKINDLEFNSDIALRDVSARCDTLSIEGVSLYCRRARVTAISSPLGRVNLDADIAWTPTKNRWSL